MELIGQIIDYIARTNLFNFAIFLGIIIFLIKKVDVSGKIGQSADDIAQTINESSVAKEESENKLRTIEEGLANIHQEIEQILKNTENSANNVGKKILDETENAIAIINENKDKSLANHYSIAKNDILRRASLASVEVAKSHIIKELADNQDLHNKLIDESLDALEGVKFE